MMYPRPVMVAAVTLDFFPIQGAYKSFSEVRQFYKRFGYGDRIGLSESYDTHQYSLKNQEAALDFLDRFNHMPLRHGLPAVTSFSDADLRVTQSGQVSVDFADAKPLVSFITEYSNERRNEHHESLAATYKSQQSPEIGSWTMGRYNGSISSREVRWEAVGSSTAGSAHIDRYVLRHSTYLAMPMLHIYDDQIEPHGTVIWASMEGKVSARDWPEVAELLRKGYQVYSFDFRGLGETRMNYRARVLRRPRTAEGKPRPGLCQSSLERPGRLRLQLFADRPAVLPATDGRYENRSSLHSQQSRPFGTASDDCCDKWDV